jgi:hypothetical protein
MAASEGLLRIFSPANRKKGGLDLKGLLRKSFFSPICLGGHQIFGLPTSNPYQDKLKKITLILFRDGRKAISKIERAVNAEFWRIFSWHTFIFASP